MIPTAPPNKINMNSRNSRAQMWALRLCSAPGYPHVLCRKLAPKFPTIRRWVLGGRGRAWVRESVPRGI